MKTISLNKQQQSEFEKILTELIYSIKKTYSNEDLIILISNILKESGLQTIKSKKNIAKNIYQKIEIINQKIANSAKNKFVKYKTNGIKTELINDYQNGKLIAYNYPSTIINFGLDLKNKTIVLKKDFLNKTKNEKIEILSICILSILIFFASGGGNDFEGGIPDMDLKFGIGFHRNIFSHSIIIGITIELLMRAGIELINETYKNLPENHHKFWDTTNSFINENKGIAISSMWAGISVHLIKDSGIFGHGVKPYNSLPLEMSKEAHQGLFTANSIASSMIAYNKN